MPKRSFRPDPLDYTDVAFFSIVGQMPDYKMAHKLNRAMGMKFRKVSDLPVYTKDSPVICSLYYFYDEIFRIKYFIIKNKNESGILAPGIKNVDYFLLAEDFTNHLHPSEFLQKIRSISGILAVLKVDVNILKEGKYILEDLELHRIEPMPQ
ncbi:MAG: IPExxxVDY family protein [Marinilabiliales bacterium]|mgnify:CR=1 FL=1|nr:MAG: IPExxxVDY family protein [Marinilabiliales bacterium]